MACGVYKMIFADGYFYIGSTGDSVTRFSTHKYHMKRGDHGNKRVQTKYNEGVTVSFQMILAMNSPQTKPSLRAEEQKILDLVFNNPYCMNVIKNADGTGARAQETKDAIKRTKREAICVEKEIPWDEKYMDDFEEHLKAKTHLPMDRTLWTNEDYYRWQGGIKESLTGRTIDPVVLQARIGKVRGPYTGKSPRTLARAKAKERDEARKSSGQ